MLEEVVKFDWKLFVYRVYQKARTVDIFVNAMSLVYTTLLSLVPLLIFSFYIMTLFNIFGGMDRIINALKEIILENLATGTGEIVIRYLEDYVTNVDITQLGVISFFSLVIVIVFMLARIEMTFNKIWGVEEHRDIFKRFVAFWTFVTLGTFLITLSLSLTISVISSYLSSDLIEVSTGNTYIFRFISIVSYFLIFIVGYYLIPNTDVEPLAAIVGGSISGFLFNLAKNLYKLYTKHAVGYNQIYGSLSVIPLFLFWLYIIWMITLLGAVICYVFQNRSNLHHFNALQDITIGIQNIIPIAILVVICKEFMDRKSTGITFAGLANKINIPVEIIEDNIKGLMAENLITITKENRYIPITTLQRISLWEICEQLLFKQEVSIKEIFADEEVCGVYAAVKDELRKHLDSLTITDLLDEEC
ncbi:tRNA-processing RNAse BN [Orenia metallireducens]|jgi:membrane protein|uniref:tRNA-processing RNAse BN n=1 Tax=Orenia metallireducens TaxID=1413210 RepID=A0A285H771_9FIRM|nr:YihY family inner membrane protein [Orenia metallireducens]PRX21133.1 tRNA-processing RNAse BN [Orenia metallireducens]SNY31597.1 tRNA-processing RNAse BN [Orenia metallireducens]